MLNGDTPNLVCDDYFYTEEADSACYTLGYNGGGSFEISYDMPWSTSEIPILMDDVSCASGNTIFLSCYDYVYDYGDHDCRHTENILLTCFESGKFKSYTLTPIRYISAISRSVISGKKIQNLLFSL